MTSATRRLALMLRRQLEAMGPQLLPLLEQLKQQLRAAANAPIQGSSADIIKVAMVQLQSALQNQGLPAQLLLQVHDELVLEVAPDALDTTRELVVQTMENAVQLSVPLAVETGEGANWMEAK